MTTSELLSTVHTITQENIDYIKKHTPKLSEKQLNWIPNPGVWSVAQILAHLNEYGNYYHPMIEKKINNTRFTSTKEGFISSPLGRSAWKSMKLGRLNNVKRKFKAPKNYNPTISPELINGNEIETFLDQQDKLLFLCKHAGTVNIRRVKVPISISKIVRLRLGDALLFITYHNQRHIQQLKNLIQSKNFPKK